MEFICELFENDEPSILGLVVGEIKVSEEEFNASSEDSKEDKQKNIFMIGLLFFQIGIVW